MAVKSVTFDAALAGASDAADDDVALVRALAAGDAEALGRLFDRHHARVHRFLARLTGGGPDLDDLVQATFMTVSDSAARFAARSAVSTWILGIAANHARHARRAHARRQALAAAVAVAPIASPAQPETLAAHRQHLARLAAALAELPHELREAFVLCDVEGVRPVDAARELEVPEGTLGRRLHEARKRLRQAVTP